MTETTKNYAPYYYCAIGSFGGFSGQPVERKNTIIQSLWTKPITDKSRLKATLFLAALSLECAHRSGYKVHMHTDNKGVELMKKFGYEELLPTLQDIPNTVPTDLFAAGKFFAMRAEGILGKIHMDIDIFLKKPYLLDRFYEDKNIDAICQMEEDFPLVNHAAIISDMHMLGYPAATRPNWQGSMNTGIVGFNSAPLASRYFRNYYDALDMYTKEKFDAYKKKYGKGKLYFDFVLEQINLSYMSVGYDVYALLPTKDTSRVADEIGYQHLQGNEKWTAKAQAKIKSNLMVMNHDLYAEAVKASHKV